jgi:caffeoyl-CoA O-methyltransferase
MSSNSNGAAENKPEPSKTIYSFMDAVAWEAEQYAADHTSPMSPLLEEIENYTLNETNYPSMLTGRVQGRFLKLIVTLSGAQNIVDIGTFTGYSALAMAESLDAEGRVLTIEHNSASADIAQAFFARSPHSDKIDLRLGEAINILQSLPDKSVDLVFIDADKINYPAYFRESMRILREGGLILADNVLWYGRIFNPQDEDSKAVAAFNEEVNGDDRAEKIFLTLRDGLYLIRKTSNESLSSPFSSPG